MSKRATGLTGLFVAVAVFIGLNLQAQQTNVGGITGTVRDASGAVIAGAAVEAANQGTTLTHGAVTNASGIYTLKLLPVGTYTVTVTARGFQKSVRTDIPVRSGEAFTVDLQLTVGQVTQTITVTGAAPILDTTTANQGTTRSADEIKGLPISMQGVATRGAIAVVQSLAGVNADTGGQNQVWTVISRAAINGVMPGEVGYQIDGVPAGMGESESAEDFGHPSPELIQEVRLTTNADASSGFDGGVTIAMTTKSGTNQLHGNVFWYNRNAALESRTFFLKDVGQDNQNEAGFSIGGPVSIPKVYDGRNKTFFFGTLSVYRMANNGPFAFQSGVASNTVPTAAMRTGDLSALLGPQTGTDALGRPVLQGEIYDPATTRADGHGGFVRDPFTYNGQLNVIDPARLSPVSTFFQEGYVLPTSPGTQLNWTGTPYPSYLGDQRYTLKVDHTIGLNHRISFSLERAFPWLCDLCKGPGGFGQGHFDYLQGAGYLHPVVANGFFVNIPQDRYRFNYVWAKTPNVLLNFRLGMTRTKNRSIEPFPSAELRTGAVSAGLTGTGSQQTPNVNIQGVSPFGPFYNLAIWSPQKLPASVDVSWTKGNHNLIFGAQYVDVSNAFNNKISTHGSFNFATLETGLPGVSSTGAGFASFLLGEVHSATVPAPLDSRESVGGLGFFAQDSWRVTPKLTVNYGLRWDVFIPMHMGQDKISSFDPMLPNPGAGGRLGALSIYGVGSGRNGLTTVAEYYYKAFGPKLGFAYSINPKTVFRASYGISYLPYYQKYAGAVSANVPSDGFTATRTAASLDNGVTPAFNWTNGFPLTFPQFPVIDPTLDNGQNIGFLDRKDNKPSMVQNIGAEVSRELPGRLSLRLGYVGTMTHGVWSSYDMNALPLSTLQYGSLLTQDINSAGAVAAGIPLPFPGFTGSVAQALRPYPQYLSVTNMGAQVGNSTYHAFQANVQKQVGDLTFLANFTTSKQLCNVFFGGAGGFGLYSAQHPALGNKAKSICGYPSETLAGDRPKVLNLSYVWNLPFGSGKRYLGGAKGALNQVVGGWRLSAVQTYQAGGNLRVTDSRAAIPGVGSIWPVLVPNVPVKAAGGCGNYDPNNPDSRYLNINAFQDPSPFALGNVSVLPSVRRCGYLNEDLGLQKEFPITERVRFMIGALGQNLFNRHYWVNLATDIGVPASFGRFSGASSGRTIQLYGRVEF